MIQLKFYSDPSHGWLRVPTKLVKELGVFDRVSEYSFVSESGRYLYLEEDCDAALVLNALPRDSYELLEVHQDKASHIRQLNRVKRG